MQWEHSATGTVIFDGRMQMSSRDLNLLPRLHYNDDDEDDDDDNERERYNIWHNVECMTPKGPALK